MDNEQKLAHTMQLHRRRFEYLDNKVKMLQSDSIEMQEGIARINKAIEAQKKQNKKAQNKHIGFNLGRQESQPSVLN